MLEIQPPDYRYCPFCGEQLQDKELEGRARRYCPKDSWIYFPHVATAAAAVIQFDNRVWLVKRNREPYKGTWMFPAGFTEYGEHPSEAVLREVLEETGYKSRNSQLIDIIQSIDDPRESGHFVFFYKVELESLDRADISDQDENQGQGWFELSNLPEIGWKSHRQIAKLLRFSTIPNQPQT